MLIAQISDLHVMLPGKLAFGCFDTSASLERCVNHIRQLRPLPDAVLATGDLVDSGVAAEYRRLRALLAPLGMPVYLIPGNHDDRVALCAEFGEHAYLPRTGHALHYAIEEYGIRLVALDTVVAGKDGGALGAGQLGWLEATLAARPRCPTLVFMHHPPFATGIRCMDELALSDDSAARLGAIITANPQVERVVCGHVHRSVQARWHGTTVSVCPSTAFQIDPGLNDDGLAAAMSEPPACQLHYWNGAELVTHTLSVMS